MTIFEIMIIIGGILLVASYFVYSYNRQVDVTPDIEEDEVRPEPIEFAPALASLPLADNLDQDDPLDKFTGWALHHVAPQDEEKP